MDAKMAAKKAADLSSEAPTTINKAGGMGSDTGCTLYQVPKALLRVGVALDHGRKKYSDYNWKDVEIKDHLSRVVVHIMGYLSGNREDDHLGHAACRALMGLELSLESSKSITVDLSPEQIEQLMAASNDTPGKMVLIPEGMKPENMLFATEIKCSDCHAEYFKEGESLTKAFSKTRGERWVCSRCYNGPQSTGTPR